MAVNKGKRNTRADITEHDQIEKRLKESEEQYRTLYEEAPNAYFSVGIDGRIIRANNRAMELLGYSLEELIGKPVFELYADTPSGKAKAETVFEKFLIGEETLDEELEMCRANGSSIWASLTVRPIIDEEGRVIASRSVVIDISERKQVEEKLLQERDRAQQYLDIAGAIIVAIDAAGLVTLINKKGCEVTGYLQEEIVGKNWFDNFLPERIREEVKGVAQKLIAGGIELAEYYENPVLTKSGEERIIAWHNTILKDGKENIIGHLSSGEDITERKKAERVLYKTEQDLKRAQAVALTGSWRMDVQRNELLWSDENHRIFGIPIGTSMTYETFLSCVHPDDRDYVDRKWQAALEGEDYDIEHRIIVGDEVRWVREKTELEFDEQGMLKGGFGTTQDITERKKTEDALRASENRYRSYIELTGELGWTTNPEGEVTEDLPSFRRFTGQSYEEIKGWGWSKALHPDDLENTLRVWEKAVAGKTSYETEYRLRRYDGIYRYFLARGVPVFEEDSRVREWVGTCIDITALKEVEQLKDEFIGLVSHELRTPLTIITGSLRSALLPGLPPEDVHELIQNAAEGADSLAVILENMLELSRYQAGHLQLNFELVAINDVAQSVVKGLNGQGATQRFTLDFVDNLPLIEADPMRVERILYNLLENATKYSPEKSEIKISGRKEEDFVVTDVVDRGQGIPRDQQKKLFELFERLETPVKTQGVGLGLAVSKRLVEAQGGWMKVDSKPGKGSTFSFALPIRKAKSQSA